MTLRNQPTARQVRLGAELRRLRGAAGLSAREVAGLLGSNSAVMSQMEAGNGGVSAERVRRLAAHYGCDDQEYIEALVAMATDRTRGWWEEYRGVLPAEFLDVSELEHHATYRMDMVLMHVPGLFQTEAYARSIFGYRVPPLPESELEPRVQHRLRRRRCIEGDAPLQYEAITHEAALRICVGGRADARRQLDWMLALSEADHITLRVVPFAREGFGGGGWSMGYVGGPVPQLDTVIRDTPHGTFFLSAETQLRRALDLFHKMEGEALPPSQSRDLIHRVSTEL